MYVLLLAALLVTGCTPTTMKMVVLDVGEGQAVLLQRAGHGILIDTGHAGKAVHVMDRLSAHGVRQLDILVLTHLHPDHASGYFRLREAFPQARLLTHGKGVPPGQSDMVRWVDQAIRIDTLHHRVQAGSRFSWQGAEVTVLWPPATGQATDLNAGSLVIRVDYARHNALLMGDAGQGVERHLLESGQLPASVDLLMVGHHGAADAAAEAFLRHVRPRYSLISVDHENIRNYPSETTVARLLSYSARLLRTDRDGEICMRWSVTQPLQICKSTNQSVLQ